MDTLIAWLNKKSVCRCIIIGYFVIYFIVGMLCVSDYGISVDEEAQRRHSLVTYKYLNEKLFDRSIPELEEIKNLEEYGASNYGVMMQMPMVAVEDLSHFTMTSRQIFLVRHIFNFVVVFIGYIFFYMTIKKITQNKWVSLIGTMMISLYPRFYECQFFDVKNMIFAGLNMIVIYYMVCIVEKPSIYSYIMFSLFAALATNQRIMAVIFPTILIGYYIITDATKLIGIAEDSESGVLRKFSLLKKYIAVIILYSLFWIVLSPFAWKSPIMKFGQTFKRFSHYGSWDGTMVFMGKLVTCDDRPWYYLFVWFGISIPIIYLVLFVVSHITLIKKIVLSDNKIETIFYENKWQLCAMVLFWGEVLSVIIINSRIYIGWHHMFFSFVPFCLVVALGINDIKSSIGKELLYSVVIISLFAQVGWMAKNHPYEITYLNEIGRPFGDQFDRDEWQTSSYNAMQWIWENEEETYVSVSGGTLPYTMLKFEDKARFYLEEEPMYIIECYRNVIGNNPEHKGYEEVQFHSVDGYKVWSVFRKQVTAEEID